MTIALDAMGSDDHPNPEIQAAIELTRQDGQELILVGNEEIIQSRLHALTHETLPIRIIHAPEVLEMTDKPVENARRKSQNSMAIGIDLLKAGQAGAFVTAGNTGGAMVSALLRLGRMPGVLRPALTQAFPVRSGRCVVVDMGANADCRPEFLLQFAVMGSLYSEKVFGVKIPRVGLLSNGEEAGKGNLLIKETYPLLAASGLNFIGNIEPKEMYAGAADVIVSDGFTGNILLKTSEAVARFITDILKEQLMGSYQTKMGALLAKPAFTSIKQLMDPSEYGAGLLLGVNGLVFIGHGRSDAHALISAVKFARQAAESDLLNALAQSIRDRMANLPSPTPIH
ncbi:MAG: phosphate acyltransferase PlsX [Anaerolineaceae bacterium]|nr:phosphate acyltransferase PlsX [Anaerolineaceae bacterium]